jgi:rhodanese-related sulfurtransferase
MSTVLSKAAILAAVLAPFASNGAEISADQNVDMSRHSGMNVVELPSTSQEAGPYCGIASVYGALRAVGINVSFSSLVDKEFIGSKSGSSTKELIVAVQANGAHAVALTNMSTESLRAMSYPVILHVASRKSHASHRFDHWVLFLGVVGDQARIAEPLHEVKSISFASLLALWDGLGILVSKDPVPLLSLWSTELLLVTSTLATILLVAILLCWPVQIAIRACTSNIRLQFLDSTLRLTTLLVTAFVFCALFQIAEGDSFLENPIAVHMVTAAYFPNKAPRIELAQLLNHLNAKDAILLDARYSSAFELGAIPGAFNVPVDSEESMRSQVLGAIDKRYPIIVYCQSTGCPFADDLVESLTDDGFENLRVFAGGYQEWQDYEHRTHSNGN